MTLGATAGLKVAATSLAAPELRVFCTERFDRVMPDNTLASQRRKLHQEDFCQILQTEPQRKYEFEGGPGLKRCAEIIRRHSALPAADLERLVRWVGFNYMIGNEDAHAKNLGLLYTDQGLHLTPHYDLLSTEVYPQLLRRLSMKIGGATDVRNVQRSDWERFATALKLPWPQVRAWLLDTAEVTRDALTQTAARCMTEYGDAPVYRKIDAIVTRRAERMQRDLAGR